MLDKHKTQVRLELNQQGDFMELRVLKYFMAVAREGSITAAANILHVTQPTLSRQLMDLEYELGHKLFQRGSHSISLTPEGILLKKRAEEILDMVQRTQAEFSRQGTEVSGDVYIGGGETCAMGQIASIVRDLRETNPNICYHLFSGNADDVTEKLDRGLLDFGLLIQPADLSKYDYLTLPYKDTWGLLMRSDNPLSAKKRIQKKDLFNQALLVSRQVANKSHSRNDLVEWLGEDLSKFKIAASYNLIYNAAIMVKEGVGCALTLDKLADTSPTSNLCFRPLMPKVEAELNIVWKKDRYFSEAAKIFLGELKRRFENNGS